MQYIYCRKNELFGYESQEQALESDKRLYKRHNGYTWCYFG